GDSGSQVVPITPGNGAISGSDTRCWPMRSILLVLLVIPLGAGCSNERFAIKTRVAGQVETRLDTPPVSPSAGNVKPVVVQNGASRVALIDVDGLILNTPFVGPLSCGENPVAV